MFGATASQRMFAGERRLQVAVLLLLRVNPNLVRLAPVRVGRIERFEVGHQMGAVKDPAAQVAGSYGVTGVALGPRPPLGVGWTLFGTYVMLAATGCAGTAVFLLNLFSDIGILGGLGWIPLVIIVYALAGAIGYGQMRRATRVLLVAEGVSIVMVTILFVIIFVKLFAGTAPNHASFSLKPFSPGPGVSTSALFLGIVFAFLSFAGFEGAATLGEETSDPKRNIGRAIGGCLILGGTLFVIGMLGETLGFGIGASGVKAFAGSSAPLGDLAHSYVGQWYRDVVDLGATLSMFAATIGGTAAAARMLFVLGRNGLGPRALAQASPKTGSPGGKSQTSECGFAC